MHRIEDGALVVALTLILAFALIQILLRNLDDDSILWADPFVRVLVLWVTMLGAMVATREGRHIGIDLLARYLPAQWLAWLTLTNGLIASGVCGLLAWYTLDLVIIEYEGQASQFADVPTWLCQTIMPFGFAVMSVRFLVSGILAPWRKVTGGPDGLQGAGS